MIMEHFTKKQVTLLTYDINGNEIYAKITVENALSLIKNLADVISES